MRLGTNNVLPANNNIRIEGGVLDLAGFYDANSGFIITLVSGGLIDSSSGGQINGANIYIERDTISAVIATNAQITKTTTQVANLTGANTYTGLTTVSLGQLNIAAGSLPGLDLVSHPNTAGKVLIDGGTLAASGDYVGVMAWLNSGRIVNDSSYPSVGSYPSGGIAITGDSAETINFTSTPLLSLGATGNYTYSGSFTAGSLTAGWVYRLGGGAGRLTFASVIADDGVNPTSVVVRGDTDGSAVTLGANNTFTGGLDLVSYYLDVSASNQFANFTGAGDNAIRFLGGTLRHQSTVTDPSGKFAAVGAGQFIRIDTNGLSPTYATTLTGAGGLSKVGTGTLTATAGYQGATNVYAGTLDLVIDGGVLVSEPSSVIDLTGEIPKILRRGKGDVSLFE